MQCDKIPWIKLLNILKVCNFWRALMVFFVMWKSCIHIFWCVRMLNLAFFTKVEIAWFAETNRKFSTKTAAIRWMCNLLIVIFSSILINFFTAGWLLQNQLLFLSYVLVFNFWQIPRAGKHTLWTRLSNKIYIHVYNSSTLLLFYRPFKLSEENVFIISCTRTSL